VGLEAMLGDVRRVAMQYSPNNAIMYVSMVDAGTVEFLRGLGKEIVSSADLVSQFEAVLSEEQIGSHVSAQRKIDRILAECWKEMGRRLRPASGGAGELTELDMVRWLSEAMVGSSTNSKETSVSLTIPSASSTERASEDHRSTLTG